MASGDHKQSTFSHPISGWPPDHALTTKTNSTPDVTTGNGWSSCATWWSTYLGLNSIEHTPSLIQHILPMQNTANLHAVNMCREVLRMGSSLLMYRGDSPIQTATRSTARTLLVRNSDCVKHWKTVLSIGLEKEAIATGLVYNHYQGDLT